MIMKNDSLKLPLGYWLRAFGDFLTGFGRSMLIPFMLIYLEQESGLAIWIITLLTAVPQFLQLFSTSWGGVLADCYGRKPIMFASLFCSGIVLTLMLSPHYLVVYTGYVLFLIVSNFYRPAAIAMITEMVDIALHRDAFAIIRMMANLGFALGPLVGSLLFFTHRPLAIAGTASAYTLTACTVFFMRETKKSLKSSGDILPGRQNPLGAYVLLKRDATLRWAVITGIFFMMIQVQLFSSFTIVVNDAFHDNGRTLAYLLLVNTAGVVAGQYFVTDITRKISFYNLVTLAILFSFAGWGTLILPLGAIRFFLLLLLTTVAEMLMASGYNPYIASLAHDGEVARYMSFSQTTVILAMMLGPTIGAFGYALDGQTGYVLILWALLIVTYASLQILKRMDVPCVAIEGQSHL